VTTERFGNVEVLMVDPSGPLLGTEQDALDLIGATYGGDVEAIVVPVERLQPEFLDLSTRMAGLFFQKLENYRLRLVVLGDISAARGRSKALNDFVGETNRIGHHLFAEDRAALAAALAPRR
jgi:hypothetical protein